MISKINLIKWFGLIGVLATATVTALHGDFVTAAGTIFAGLSSASMFSTRAKQVIGDIPKLASEAATIASALSATATNALPAGTTSQVTQVPSSASVAPQINAHLGSLITQVGTMAATLAQVADIVSKPQA